MKPLIESLDSMPTQTLLHALDVYRLKRGEETDPIAKTTYQLIVEDILEQLDKRNKATLDARAARKAPS